MADYIYLLENRLSAAQRQALEAVRHIARNKGLTVFLVGGAVRDLTCGAPVSDLDVVVQGNALKLKKELQLAGAVVAGEYELGQALFVRFPGSVRMEIGSALSVAYPKPGKPVFHAATILEDLRRRDFTANSMALSLNAGSYGLLMDPLNGVADIENRQLRLTSNYGFIEDPARMIRAARLKTRLGWTLEEKTESRYRNGIAEGYISALSDFHRGYELEEIVHEEDPLRVMVALEADGWLQVLAPYWTSAKANAAELEKLRNLQTKLQLQGIHPDAAAAHFPLVTAKLQPKEIAQLKHAFARPGFVAEIDGLEAAAKEFAAQLGAKTASSPSQAWTLLVSASPEAVLWTAYSSKSASLQAKFASFFTEWPLVRQRIPYALMSEMRITPELPGFADLVEKLFFQLLDGHLGTVEEMKAFLEPYSPPAPPPPPSTRRARASKKDAKPKGRARKALSAKLEDGDEDAVEIDLDETDLDVDVDEVELIDLPALADEDEAGDDPEADGEEDEEAGDDERPVQKAAARTAPVKPAKIVAPAPKSPPKAAIEKAAKPVVPAEKVAVKPVAKAPVNAAAPAKAAAKPVSKSASVKPEPASKPKVAAAAKKPAPAKPVAKKSGAAKKAVPAKKPAAKKSNPAPPAKNGTKSAKQAKQPAVKVVAKAKPVPPKKKSNVAHKAKSKAKSASPAKRKR